MENEEKVRARVALGVQRLDEHFGPDWPHRIDLESLDLASSYDCVLGQLFGEFWTGVQTLWPDFDGRGPARDHGFLCETRGPGGCSCPDLNEVWPSAIQAARLDFDPEGN